MYPNLFTLSFNPGGSPVNHANHRAAIEHLQTQTAQDVLFITHGWLNDTPHAPRLFAFFASALPEVTVCGVLWPTQPFGPYGVMRPDREAAAHYILRERAATIGCAGLGPVLANLALSRPSLRIHLAGHSFGARMMIESATQHSVHSLTLIQPALPADLFQQAPGRALLDDGNVHTPIVVTSSRHDHAIPGSLAQCGHADVHPSIQNLNLDHVLRAHTDLYHLELAAAIKSRCCPLDTTPPFPPSSPVHPAIHTAAFHPEPTPAAP